MSSLSVRDMGEEAVKWILDSGSVGGGVPLRRVFSSIRDEVRSWREGYISSYNLNAGPVKCRFCGLLYGTMVIDRHEKVCSFQK